MNQVAREKLEYVYQILLCLREKEKLFQENPAISGGKGLSYFQLYSTMYKVPYSFRKHRYNSSFKFVNTLNCLVELEVLNTELSFPSDFGRETVYSLTPKGKEFITAFDVFVAFLKKYQSALDGYIDTISRIEIPFEGRPKPESKNIGDVEDEPPAIGAIK